MEDQIQIPLNSDTRQIFGRVNFACRNIAIILRKKGYQIAESSEDEQAVVIWWTLLCYLKFGDKWAEEGSAILRGEKEDPFYDQAAWTENKAAGADPSVG